MIYGSKGLHVPRKEKHLILKTLQKDHKQLTDLILTPSFSITMRACFRDTRLSLH